MCERERERESKSGYQVLVASSSSASATSLSSRRSDFLRPTPTPAAAAAALAPPVAADGGDPNDAVVGEDAACLHAAWLISGEGEDDAECDNDECDDPFSVPPVCPVGIDTANGAAASARSADGELNVAVAFVPVSITPLSCDVSPSVSATAGVGTVGAALLIAKLDGVHGVKLPLRLLFDPSRPFVSRNEPDEFRPIVPRGWKPVGAR